MRTILPTLGLALLSLLSCTPPKPEPLRIGINPWPGYEFLALAQEKGFFKRYGVDIRLLEFSSLGDARRAYELGQLDGFAGTLVEAVVARATTQRKPQVIYYTDYSSGADVVLSKKDIKSVRDLKGKRVGLELGTLNVYLLTRALEKYGMIFGDLTLVPVDLSSMPQAFRDGEIDAAVTYPPASTEILKDSSVRTLFTSSEIPEELVDVILFDESVLATRSKDVSAMLKAFEEARRYSETNTEEAYAIMAKRERISVEEFRKAITSDMKILGREENIRLISDKSASVGLLSRLERALCLTKQIPCPVVVDGIVDGRTLDLLRSS